MNDTPANVPPSEPVLPPDDHEGQRATWPTLIGILSIIYAVFGVIANGCGIAFIFVGGSVLALTGIDGADFQLPTSLKIVQTVLAAIGIGLAILLAVGAVGLLRRRPSAVRLLKIWVVMSIVVSLASVGVGFASLDANIRLQMDIQDAVRDRMKETGQDPDQMPGLSKTEADFRTESIAGVAIGGGLPILFPLIVGFVVTSRRRVQQVEAWDDQAPVA